MKTPIYVSHKLQKLIKNLIQIESGNNELGGWNATVFYVNRKKCWLLTNIQTKYSVILAEIRSSDMANIRSKFVESFYQQLNYDGIPVDRSEVESAVGELHFLTTNNDKKTIGHQNQRLHELQYWIREVKTLDDMLIYDLTNRINITPIFIGTKIRMSDLTDPVKQMKLRWKKE